MWEMCVFSIIVFAYTPFALQGKYDEAGQLYDRSLAIREKALGPDHPDVAQSLNNRALLLEDQVRVILIVSESFHTALRTL